MSRQSSPPSSSGNPMAGAMIVAGVGLCLAILLAVFGGPKDSGTNQTEAVENARSKPSPFADLKRTPPPTAGQRKATATNGTPTPRAYDSSPENLMDAGEWLRGTVHASRAKKFDMEAAAAKKKGNDEVYLKKGVAARIAYDAALTEVRDWELKIRDKYGDGDRKVRKIIKEITAWSKGWRRYRKLGISGN